MKTSTRIRMRLLARQFTARNVGNVFCLLCLFCLCMFGAFMGTLAPLAYGAWCYPVALGIVMATGMMLQHLGTLNRLIDEANKGA